MDYLVESALLIHGIKNLTDETMRRFWTAEDARIVWVEKGELKTGGIEQLLDFRRRMKEACIIPRRANHFNLEQYMEMGADAVLTASGAMSVCAREGIGAAVTAGIGGFFPEMLADNGKHLTTRGFGPPDVATLDELNVVLVSSGPKDMLDYKGTFRYLDEHGIRVLGVSGDTFNGYLFIGEEAPLSGRLGDQKDDSTEGSVLIVNQISEDKRISDRSILDAAVQYGLGEEKKGGYYHPAVNAKIEELTKGYSAVLQLAALSDNAKLAGNM